MRAKTSQGISCANDLVVHMSSKRNPYEIAGLLQTTIKARQKWYLRQGETQSVSRGKNVAPWDIYSRPRGAAGQVLSNSKYVLPCFRFEAANEFDGVSGVDGRRR